MFVDGVDDYQARRCGLAGGEGLAERLGEDHGAEALALMVSDDGEAGEEHHRDR